MRILNFPHTTYCLHPTFKSHRTWSHSVLFKLTRLHVLMMTRQALIGFAALLLAFNPTSAFNSSEAQQAKGLVDSLSKRLHNNLKGYKDIIERTEEKISKTVEELLIVKKVQVLLGHLNNQHVPGELCEHRYIVPDFHYKQDILIETRSTLPSQYTITLQGNISYKYFTYFIFPLYSILI